MSGIRPAQTKIGELRAWTFLPSIATLAIGAPNIFHQSVWRDEVATSSAARLPISGLFHLTLHIQDIVFLPYYLFLHFWLKIGTSAAWMRLPSLIAAAAAVYVLTRFAEQRLSRRWAVIAGLLLALNPLFVRWSIQARPYAIACFFATLVMTMLVIAIKHPRPSRWWLLGVSSFGLVLFHELGVLLLVALFFAVAYATDRRTALSCASVMAIATLLTAPIAILAVHEDGQISWIAKPGIHTFFEAADSIAGGRVGTIFLVFAAIFVATRLVRHKTDADQRLFESMVTLGAALPAIFLVVASFAHPLFVDRYLLVSVPSVALVEAIALERVWSFTVAKTQLFVPRFHTTPHSVDRTISTEAVNARSAAPSLVLGAAVLVLIAAILSITSERAIAYAGASYYYDDFQSATAALTNDLAVQPSRVLITSPGWVTDGLNFYASPKISQDLHNALTTTQPHVIPLSRGVETGNGAGSPRSSTCAAGWAVGTTTVRTARNFNIDGVHCALASYRYFGDIWIARVSPTK